jgi:hypothetical protein
MEIGKGLAKASAEEIITNEIPVCVDSGCAGWTYFAVVSFQPHALSSGG